MRKSTFLTNYKNGNKLCKIYIQKYNHSIYFKYPVFSFLIKGKEKKMIELKETSCHSDAVLTCLLPERAAGQLSSSGLIGPHLSVFC